MTIPKKGFLTARYISPSNYEFEFQEIYRLEYELKPKGGITIHDVLDINVVYDSIAEFRSEWDMDNVPERYKEANPKLS